MYKSRGAEPSPLFSNTPCRKDFSLAAAPIMNQAICSLFSNSLRAWDPSKYVQGVG